MLTPLEGDPDAVAPIAAAFMIGAPTPAIVTVVAPVAMEVPVIRVIFEGDSRPVIAGIDMPAIAFAIAGHIGNSGDGKRHQGAGAGNATEDEGLKLHEVVLLANHAPPQM